MKINEGKGGSHFLRAGRRRPRRLLVELVSCNVLDNFRVDEVSHRSPPAHGQANLRRADVGAHVRRGQVDVLPVLVEHVGLEYHLLTLCARSGEHDQSEVAHDLQNLQGKDNIHQVFSRKCDVSPLIAFPQSQISRLEKEMMDETRRDEERRGGGPRKDEKEYPYSLFLSPEEHERLTHVFRVPQVRYVEGLQ